MALQDPGQGNRFEVWIKDVKVASSDHECFVRVFVDGTEVFNMAAQVDYEDPRTLEWGERPKPVGFSAKATAKNLDGSDARDLGKRTWKTLETVEVTKKQV